MNLEPSDDKVVGKEDLHDIRLKVDPELTYTPIRSERRSQSDSSVDSPLITMVAP